jgi:hypothetical protein
VTTTPRTSSSAGEKLLKKPLLIPDHINYWNGLEDDDDDSFVTNQLGDYNHGYAWKGWFSRINISVLLNIHKLVKYSYRVKC